jgi:hypothetical protein
LKPHEIESLIRSAAMAPCAAETTRCVLFEYKELLAKHDALRELMARLGAAWGELRAALNELATMMDQPWTCREVRVALSVDRDDLAGGEPE